MTKEQLIEKLKSLIDNRDIEGAHVTADNLLLEYINDKEVSDAFHNIEKWYA